MNPLTAAIGISAEHVPFSNLNLLYFFLGNSGPGNVFVPICICLSFRAIALEILTKEACFLHFYHM